MSVRTKAPLSVIAILLINFIALVGYVVLFLPERVMLLVEQNTGVRISVQTLLSNRFVHSIIMFEGVVFLILAAASAFLAYVFNAKPLMQLNAMVSSGLRSIPQTSRKDEVGQLQNSFAALSGELQQEKQNQDRMMAGISHDIKTPLTSIAGYSETLLKKELSEEQIRQYLNVIFMNAQRIEQIVEEFDLYVEGHQPLSLQKKEYDVSFLEEMLREEYEGELQSRNISFVVSNACPAGAKLSCDIARLRRVFANLIHNCLKHNSNAKNFTIGIGFAVSGAQLLISVQDNGRGVDEKDIPYLFDPFYSSDTDRTRHGLGLSICRDIVAAHGGRIEAKNGVEGGLEICIFLPM